MPSLDQQTILKEIIIPRVDTTGSIESTQEGVSLTNDEETPGANKVYGTDGDGAKGWHAAAEASGVEAEDVSFEPAGNIAATDVQAAIEELDSEKAGLTQVWRTDANTAITNSRNVDVQAFGEIDLNIQANTITVLNVKSTTGVTLGRSAGTQIFCPRTAAAATIAGDVGLLKYTSDKSGSYDDRTVPDYAAVKAYADAAAAAVVDSSPEALDTLNELAAALGDDANFATTVTNALALKAPLASPALTGTPTAPTADAGTDTDQLATTAFVKAAVDAGGGGGDGWTKVVLGSDVVNNDATADTLADVTGLSFPVVANKKFAFRFVVPYSASSVTGARFAINGPTLTRLNAYGRNSSGSGGGNIGISWHSAYNGGTLSANTAPGATQIIDGVIECSAADTEVIARFSSEVSGSAVTSLAGAYVEYIQLD